MNRRAARQSGGMASAAPTLVEPLRIVALATTAARGVTASGATLVARSGSPKQQLSLDLGAGLATLDVVQIAAAAQHHLHAVARADKQSASFEFAHRSTPWTADAKWTQVAGNAIWKPHLNASMRSGLGRGGGSASHVPIRRRVRFTSARSR